MTPDYDDLLDEVLVSPDPKPVKKPKAAPRRKPPKKKQAIVQTDTKLDSPEPQPARRGMSRHLERSGRCPMYVPRGTKCKSCGQVHTW